MENQVRVYILTDNEEDLLTYDILLQQISGKLDQISKLPFNESYDIILNDSVNRFALEKLEAQKTDTIYREHVLGKDEIEKT